MQVDAILRLIRCGGDFIFKQTFILVFENGVILYGSQTFRQKMDKRQVFENGVIKK